MTRRLPPLNSLRAFEAAARHQSLSEAARELCVTHGAVGRHVAKLEEYLGAELFIRENNRLTLTARGGAYAAQITLTLDQIRDATAENFGVGSWDSPLRIGSYPNFANQVLIPRLARFREEFPDVPFEITTSHTPFDPAGGEVDVAVWLGTGNWPGLVERYLFGEELIPVGSPDLLQSRPSHDADDLRSFTLLHVLHRPDDWENWFNTAGVHNAEAHRGLRFEHSGMVYQAAANQLGLAMAQRIHVRDAIEHGRLVCPFDLPLRTDRSYFLVYSAAKADDPRILAFAEWIGGEIAQHPRTPHRLGPPQPPWTPAALAR